MVHKIEASPKALRGLSEGVVGGRGYLFAIVALIGALLGLSEYEDKVLEGTRRIAHEQYAMVVNNLGSDSLVVRVGALGQLPTLLRTPVPARGKGHRAAEGLMYLLGYHDHAATYPYQDDLLRVIRALVVVPKEGDEGERLEADALLSMLCELGAEGWYNAEIRSDSVRAEECLEWIWKDAPSKRRFEIPSYALFRGARLRGCDFSRRWLRRANFAEAILASCQFADSTLTRAYFSGAKLDGVDFSNADLRYGNFEGASLYGVNFSGASLQYASFAGADIDPAPGGVVFDQANVAGVDFRDTGIEIDILKHALNTRLTQGAGHQGEGDAVGQR